MSYQFARGGWIACLCAGPVFAASLVFATMLESPSPVALDAQWGMIAGGALVMIMPVIVIGMLLAFFPVWLGAKLLAWAGSANIGLRHPAFWAIMGGAIPGSLLPVIDLGSDRHFGTALIATGAICAVIVRYGTRWSDDSV